MIRLFDGPADAAAVFAFAHGAGAPMDSPFMSFFAARLGAAGVRVARFEFPYMAERRANGTKRPPDRQPVLLGAWRRMIDDLGAPRLFIGGKSMGGRMASLIADDERPAGLVCLGYPFHPPGKPERLRIEHLIGMETPTLILQGERDPMGGRATVPTDALSPAVTLRWLPDGDHSFKPRRAAGLTEAENLTQAAEAVIAFLSP